MKEFYRNHEDKSRHGLHEIHDGPDEAVESVAPRTIHAKRNADGDRQTRCRA